MTTTRTFTVSLIRHGPTIYPKGTLPPHDPDVDLDDLDKIKHVAGLIPDDATWHISPLSRCQRTAQALIDHGGNPASHKTDGRIFEQEFGDWHGLPIALIWDQVKDQEKTNWFFLHPEITPPKGESFTDMMTRLTPVMEEITSFDGDHLVLVCHGLVIRGFLGMMLGMTPAQALAFKIDPLSITQLTHMAEGSQNHDRDGGTWFLDFLNR